MVDKFQDLHTFFSRLCFDCKKNNQKFRASADRFGDRFCHFIEN